jgi:hypothetical protein
LGAFSIHIREAVFEKRTAQRRSIKAAIVCNPLRPTRSSEAIEGLIKNCCTSGFCAELKAHVTEGTILVVGTAGGTWGDSLGEGRRRQSLAEVRWSRPTPVDGEFCCAAGLKYLRAM